MQKYEVTHLDDKAVCNDGSSGVYYHRIGSPLNSTRHGGRHNSWHSLRFH